MTKKPQAVKVESTTVHITMRRDTKLAIQKIAVANDIATTAMINILIREALHARKLPL